MVDTLWADISEFQRAVDDSYPHRFICIRSNDGTHRDAHFAVNRAWCDRAVASGKLLGYLVYYFYRPAGTGLATCQTMVGAPSPHMALMVDVESAGGAISGNQSARINAEVAAAVAWLGDARRVVGYGNVGDLNALWPTKPAGIRLVVAHYSANPAYPGKFAHQYTDRGICAPFGTCDMNSADGMAPEQVAALLGLAGASSAPVPAAPAPAAPPPVPALKGKPVFVCHTPSTQYLVFDNGTKVALTAAADGSALTDAAPKGLGLPYIALSEATVNGIPNAAR